MAKRIIADIVLFMGMVIFPWWLSIIMAVLFSLIFKSYFEVMIWGIASDILYGASLKILFNQSFFYTALSVIIFSLTYFARKRLSFYWS